MTRRDAILLGLGLPLWASENAFWNETKPSDWTAEERRQLLTRSPWARPAEVKFNSGPGSLAWPDAGMYGMPGTIPSNPTDAPRHYGAMVRWESALPVREATGSKAKNDFGGDYVVSVLGDLPMIGNRVKDESEDEYQARLDNLKQYTRLEKHGGPIYLVKIGYQPGPDAANSGTRFYFDRNNPITLRDGQVTFVTRLGPIDVKCKFPLKEMVFRGELEL